MFDTFAQTLFNNLPVFEGLTPESARRTLSRAYLAVIELRTGQTVPSDVYEVLDYLRRLADTIEFHTVLDESLSLEIRKAGSFVAAESLALLVDFYEHGESLDIPSCRLRHNGTYTRVEAAILYLIAGYDACAGGVVSKVFSSYKVKEELSPGELGAEWCLEVLIALCMFQLNPLPEITCNLTFGLSSSLKAIELEDDTVGRLYAKLGEAVSNFLHWLAGDSNEGAAVSKEILQQLLEKLKSPEFFTTISGIGGDYGRIRHLSELLLNCFSELSRRALIHVVPLGLGFPPDVYKDYLRMRACGERPRGSGRPVLWPSTEGYVKYCILDDIEHAVVSMPTGSGKSFVAELAVSQAVGLGWCLYLAPTNALAEQIRGDLRSGLKPLGTEVLAFIGDQEYSVLKTNVVSVMPLNSVAVMTPEKAHLALRLYPDVFTSCQLVVFDECHLIGEANSGRSVTAELVLTQLIMRATNIRILLMSAIVQNPGDLAKWLAEATGGSSVVLSEPWRPTRTLRSALGIDAESFIENRIPAYEKLKTRPESRKNENFTAFYSLACGLQGAWQSTNEADYGIVKIPCEAQLCVSRKKVPGGDWQYYISGNKWVNGSAIRIAKFLAENTIQTLVFTPANKHYPFSNAAAMELSRDCLATLEEQPEIVQICRVLAEFEFGLPSDVFTFIDKGLSVHTSHMIETEKIASEYAFRARATRVMHATGTLAQGLNLPAMAVIIGGTRIGDPRGEDIDVVEQRKLSQLLNAAGRAGRAGFANQGLVVAIPDKPLTLDSYSAVENLKNRLGYLEQPDNAVKINSGLESFLDRVTQGVLDAETASEVELQTIAVLSGGGEGQLPPVEVLRKSYAGFQRRAKGQPDVNDQAAVHLAAIRDNFVAQPHVPSWVPIAAQRAGLDFFIIVSLVNAWARVREVITVDMLNWSIFEWTEELLRVVSHVPPGILLRRYSMDTIGRGSPKLAAARENYRLQSITNRDWAVDGEWAAGWLDTMRVLIPWMEGKPLVELASIITGIDAGEIKFQRTSGQPIPKTISLINDLFSSLAILGGGIVAVAEQLFQELCEQGGEEFCKGVPLALSCMPMCIKYGCDSPESLAWFRFGVRLRRPSRIMYEAFPPPKLDNDEELRDWVRRQRRIWLRIGIDDSIEHFQKYKEIFQAIANFIRGE
ncbi:MAG: DEAD/DEAH box helicase [Dehalobacter sp.]|nr:DEAD/DEAH box helicase [Dehalobacter sp.]